MWGQAGTSPLSSAIGFAVLFAVLCSLGLGEQITSQKSLYKSGVLPFTLPAALSPF